MELIEKLRELTEKSDDDYGSVIIRQSHNHITEREQRCETFEIIFQRLLQNDFPSWFALSFAAQIIREHEQDIIPNFNDLYARSIASYGEPANHVDSPKSVEEEKNRTVPMCFFGPLVLKNFQLVCESILSKNETSSIPTEPYCKPLYAFSVHAIKNSRRRMEDRHVVVPNLEFIYKNKKALKDSAFFAVYDGHGGPDCSNYVSTHLMNHFVDNLTSFDDDVCNNDKSVMSAFRQGFRSCEIDLLKKCELEKMRSGTTAVCTFVKNRTVYVAWVGDSQAVLIDFEKEARTLTPCHDTKNEPECKRIEDEKGILLDIRGELRVNGVINVTRSFGDNYLKPPLSAEPDVNVVHLTGSESVLILGCDGLWEGLKLNQCNELIRAFFKDNPIEKYCDLAKFLVKHAKEKDVSDNITALVVFLKPLDELKQLL